MVGATDTLAHPSSRIVLAGWHVQQPLTGVVVSRTRAERSFIVVVIVDEVRERLAERGIGLTLTEAARAALVAEGYDPAYGARPLRRVIQRRVENAVSKCVLAGAFARSDLVGALCSRTRPPPHQVDHV